MSMWTQGAITHQTLLEILSRGEILPEIDVEAEIEMIESDKLAGLDLQAAGGSPANDEAKMEKTVIPVVSKTRKFAKKYCVDYGQQLKTTLKRKTNEHV